MKQDNKLIWSKFIASSDNNSFTRLYNYYVDKLYSYGIYLGFDSEMCKDAIQDVFMKIYSSPSKLNQVSNPASFLFQSFKNRLIDITRSNKNELDIDPTHNSFTIDINILDDMIDNERAEMLKERVRLMLENLSDTQREAVYLRYIAGLEYSEISKKLNIKQDSARKLMYRTIKTLREQNIEGVAEVTQIAIILLLV